MATETVPPSIRHWMTEQINALARVDALLEGAFKVLPDDSNGAQLVEMARDRVVHISGNIDRVMVGQEPIAMSDF